MADHHRFGLRGERRRDKRNTPQVPSAPAAKAAPRVRARVTEPVVEIETPDPPEDSMPPTRKATRKKSSRSAAADE